MKEDIGWLFRVSPEGETSLVRADFGDDWAVERMVERATYAARLVSLDGWPSSVTIKGEDGFGLNCNSRLATEAAQEVFQ